MPHVPSRASTVIIGGGIIGLSVAYHLARAGQKEVILLERRQLTCGTTWHAAGLVTQLRATENMARMAQYTATLFEQLTRETGQETGFQQCGSVTLATTPHRLEELKRGASMGRSFGLEVDIIGRDRVAELFPGINVDDVVGAAWIPSDGKTNPVDTARAYAAGARLHGATIIENAEVTKILVKDGRAVGVETHETQVDCANVVLCGGMWSRELARSVGVTVPLHAAEHFYVVTESMPGLPKEAPVLRDMDGCFYAKEDAGRLLVGAFERDGKPWGSDGIPRDFCFDQLPDDMEHFAPYLEKAIHRLPQLGSVGLQTFFNGPESFTPDGRFLLGEAPNVANFFVASGFNSCGIESSGGAGKILADWIVAGRAPGDYWEVDIRRAQPFQRSVPYLRDRTRETVGLLYDVHWPGRFPESSRGARQSPLHDRFARAGASFGEAAGWERPMWFARNAALSGPPYAFNRPGWFDASAMEHRAARSAAALFDVTSFAHILMVGADAERVLNRLCVADVRVPPGQVVYTQCLNELGGIETDVTVTRLSGDQYMIVTPGVQRMRDIAWFRRKIEPGERAAVVDQSSAFCTMAVMGPQSRDVLSGVVQCDLDDAAFPFATAREIEIGYGLGWALRMTYVGELGWELHVPSDHAPAIFDLLVEHGSNKGLTFAGYHALESLRLECGYRDWGVDISEEENPIEAGLGFTIAWDKEGGFLGKEALAPQRGRLPAKRILPIAIDSDAPLFHGTEPVWRDGVLVGYAKCGAFGHTIGRPVGLAQIRHPEGVSAQWLRSGTWELEIACARYPAELSLRPFFDPQRLRVKGAYGDLSKSAA